MKRASFTIIFLLALGMVGCGGGGGTSTGGGSSSVPTVPSVLTITTDSVLPSTLQGQPYSATLSAINAQGSLKWTIAPQAPTALFVDGLTIDSATGVLSGTSKFQGTAGFIATVTDANSRTASKSFYVTAASTLVAGPDKNLTASQWGGVYVPFLGVQGGVAPLSYFVSSGSLPPGVRVDKNGIISGNALQPGSYSAAITIRDSWSPPEAVTQNVNFTVSVATLSLQPDIPPMFVNRPVTAAFVPVGGVPPYSYQITFGTVPPGMNFDTSTGKISGTPSAVFNASVAVQVKDSAGSTSTATSTLYVTNARGRNDSVQTATLTGNTTIYASLSPYIDPPDKAPTAADTDYYKIVSMAGSIVKVAAVDSNYGGLIDPVIEVVDANGVRLATCNTPDTTSTTYTSACVNDEDGTGGHNAALEYKVPGAPATVVNSYIHVLDWRGDARPDMQYSLSISGSNEPNYVNIGAPRGAAYTYQFSQDYRAFPPVTWTLDNGTLPAGLALSSSGVLSGTPTTNGQYTFRLKAIDSASTPQTYYYFVTMTIEDQFTITSPASWPVACVNQPYVFAITTSSGTAPFTYGINSVWWGNFYPGTDGTINTTPLSYQVGTFTGALGVRDAVGVVASQQVTLTIKNCP